MKRLVLVYGVPAMMLIGAHAALGTGAVVAVIPAMIWLLIAAKVVKR